MATPPAAVDFELLGDEELRQYALGAAALLVKSRLLLGRLLLEIYRRDLVWQWGYSCLGQFAALGLKMQYREVKEALFVVRKLQDLPLLRDAAETGGIGWSFLYEVCRVATPETEEEWLHLARTRSYRKLRALVSRAAQGLSPDDDSLEEPLPYTVHFGMDMYPEEAELQQGAISALSLQAGRVLTPVEAHMEMYRMVAEGRIRTSARGVVQTEEVLADLARLREQQEAQDLAAAREQVHRGRRSRSAESEAPPTGEAVSDVGRSPGHEEAAFEAVPGSVTLGRAPDHEEGPAGEAVSERVIDGRAPDPSEVSDCDEGLPALPWAAARVAEAGCPENPEVLTATSSPRGARHGFPDIGCSCADCRAQRSRHIPRDVRRAVVRRDGFHCQSPDCPHTVWLDLHHIVFWCEGGLSVPNNLVLLCRSCHRSLHQGHLRIRGTPETGLVFLDGRGRPLGATTAAEEARAAGFADRNLAGVGASGGSGLAPGPDRSSLTRPRSEPDRPGVGGLDSAGVLRSSGRRGGGGAMLPGRAILPDGCQGRAPNSSAARGPAPVNQATIG